LCFAIFMAINKSVPSFTPTRIIITGWVVWKIKRVEVSARNYSHISILDVSAF
jgi:hypothetical protein